VFFRSHPAAGFAAEVSVFATQTTPIPVRTHMKRVLAKTGVKRQADFIVRFSTFKSLEKAGGQ
jgi:hypothetical protein